MKRRFALVGVALVVVLSGCASVPTPRSLTETIAADPKLSTLSKLVAEAGLAETLAGAGPFTVFAPSNDAFAALPEATTKALMADKTRLKALLTYHVLPEKLALADVKNGPAKTVQGASVTLYRSGTFLTIEDAVVTQPDVAATNGVVHVVDRVLTLPAAR